MKRRNIQRRSLREISRGGFGPAVDRRRKTRSRKDALPDADTALGKRGQARKSAVTGRRIQAPPIGAQSSSSPPPLPVEWTPSLKGEIIMMKKIVIRENERGFLFKDGTFQRVLKSGKYRFFGNGYDCETVKAAGRFALAGFDSRLFQEDETFRRETVHVEVEDETVALHYIDGRFDQCLTSGSYDFWAVHEQHEFMPVSMKNVQIGSEVPRYVFDYLPRGLYKKVEVAPYQKALLFIDQKLDRVLDEGTYYFWNNGVKVDVTCVDTRLLQMDITGQEIMTLDKVGLRINFVAHYKIADVIKACTEIQNLEEQIHILMQLALREYVGRYRLDELLENKEQLSQYVFAALKEKEADYYITFFDAGVKDIVLPGEVRDIMNTVLLAEKKAQANVITRREEVASTRSLLNTARLMEENKTLYKLKELEYLEKICDNVGNITVSGGSDLLSQLTAVLRGA